MTSPFGPSRRVIALLFALTTIGGATTLARADGSTVQERSVEVVLLGGGRDTGALVDTVRELLGRLRLVANVHAVAGDDDAAKVARGASVARIVVDLRVPSETVLTVDGREGGPSRRVVRRDPSPSVAREELAHAIQGAIEAQLLVDGDRPPPPPPPPIEVPPPSDIDHSLAIVIPPAPPPRDATPPAPTAATWGLDVTPLGGAGYFAPEAGPTVLLGGDIGLASRRGFAPSATLSIRGVLPFEGEVDSVTARASAISLRAHGGLELVHVSWLALGVLAGGGMDVITVDPRSRTLPPNVLGATTTRVDPILSLGVRLSFPIVSSVALTVVFVGDLDLTGRDYVVNRGGVEESALSPSRVRPAMLAGFTFTPFGSGIFAPRGVP